MPTIPATITSEGVGEIYRTWLQNLGVTQNSLGLGECLTSLANAAAGNSAVGGTELGPTNTIAHSVPRQLVGNVAASLASGTLQMSAVFLLAGEVITNINWLSGTTAGATLDHQWGAIFSGPASGPLLVATSADATSAAIAANSVITYPIATTAAGTATTYTVLTSGIYYVGIMVHNNSGTEPTAQGFTATASALTIPPILSGTSTASLTGILTFPATAQTTITPTAFTIETWLT